jgi:HNH endonuclease/AP2 domain
MDREQKIKQFLLENYYICEEGFIRRKIEKRKKYPVGSIVQPTNHSSSNHFVFVFRFNNKQTGMSYGKVSWLLYHGDYPPKGLEVDHIDRNPRNNRKDNLRLATRSQQLCNNKRQNTKHRGVYYEQSTGKWFVQVQYEGKVHWGGRFSTKEEAMEVREKMAKEIHGEFAVLN